MKPISNLKGKTAWITGGKRIGQKLAEALAQQGVNLILSYRKSQKEAEELVKKVKKFGVKTLIIKADVSSQRSVALAVEEIKKQFKKIDILIPMASIFEPIKLMSIKEEGFKKNFDAHVLGTFWPIQASLNIMPSGSHIVTISDRTSISKPYAGYLPYVVTKGAVAHMTRVLAVELGSRGIFVNSIAPGAILKPDNMSDAEWIKVRRNSIVNYPIKDKESVEEFVKLALYLCRVRSTGSIYPLDLGNL